MHPIATISADELKQNPGARLWALVSVVADSARYQADPRFRRLWLVWSYDSEVNNGGHLQYFHNRGIQQVPETLAALREIGADRVAALLESCWERHRVRPVLKVSSLKDYSRMASERSFPTQDAAFYQEKPPLLDLLEAFYAPLLAAFVAVDA